MTLLAGLCDLLWLEHLLPFDHLRLDAGVELIIHHEGQRTQSPFRRQLNCTGRALGYAT